MPDLGPYAFEVTLAYVGSLALLAALVWQSARQSRNSKTHLEELERRQDG